MRESLDFWLTQYNRPLSVLENGEFLRAHFAKLTFTASSDSLKVSRHDFEQIKVIGRGAFSRVILVRKKDTGRLYAMKIMRKDKLVREQKIKPIINERKIME
jgi:serine/threonine protein kinase